MYVPTYRKPDEDTQFYDYRWYVYLVCMCFGLDKHCTLQKHLNFASSMLAHYSKWLWIISRCIRSFANSHVACNKMMSSAVIWATNNKPQRYFTEFFLSFYTVWAFITFIYAYYIGTVALNWTFPSWLNPWYEQYAHLTCIYAVIITHSKDPHYIQNVDTNSL